MNRIDEKLQILKKDKKKALVVFLTAGYPDMVTTEKFVYCLEEWGVDIVELGVPFSDPIADGPTIQYSSFVSLKRGTSLKKVLGLVSRIRKKSDIPLVLMSYYNPVYQYPDFFSAAGNSGIDGVIVPDLLPEENILTRNGKKITECNLSGKNAIDLIYLLTPNSNEQRIELVTRQSQGFVYLVSLTGVTGARNRSFIGLKPFLRKVRNYTDKPLFLGFGISRTRQVREIIASVDGIIVGSAIIDIIRKYKDPVPAMKKFIFGLKKTII